MKKRIWITWEVQRRNRSMSTKLNADLYEITLNAPSWRRYPVLIYKSIKLILCSKPYYLFAQNPSLVLSAISVMIGRLIRVPVILDAHNAGLFPLEGRHNILTDIAAWINKRATLVIVSNNQLKEYVESKRGHAFAMPDPIPEITCDSIYSVNTEKFNILYICSWAEDEPFSEVIKAAREVIGPITLYMTGNSKGRHRIDNKGMPENVVLTGFLSVAEYEKLLCSCDAVMVLTKRSNCLVCGAYEGVSVEKPLILSDETVLRQQFTSGVIYTRNTVTGIRDAIKQVISEHSGLTIEVKRLKKDLIEESKRNIQLLEYLLNEM